MNNIEFKAKTDRELLGIIVHVVNEINKKLDSITVTLIDHEKRFVELEKAHYGKLLSPLKRINGRFPLTSAGGIIVAVVGGIIYGVGRGLSWW